MWLGSGGGVNAQATQKPDLSGQHDILFNDLYQEVRCAAPSAQVIKKYTFFENFSSIERICHVNVELFVSAVLLIMKSD